MASTAGECRPQNRKLSSHVLPAAPTKRAATGSSRAQIAQITKDNVIIAQAGAVVPAEASEIFIHDLANIIYPSRPLQDSRDFAMTENPSPAVGNHGTLQSVESSFYIRSYQNEQDFYADNPQKVLLTQLAPDQAFLPFWPSSPFGLALMALLVLLPLQEDLDPMRETQIEVRNSYANIYARAALESVDGFCSGQEQTGAAPVSTPGMDDVPRSAIHPELPSTLDPVLALLLLGVYEYCQNSNRRLMRARIYSALILAMDLSLHICQPTNSEHSIIQARVWWNTLWSTSMRAQEALLETGFVAKQMTEGNIKGSHEHTQKRIRELDSFILAVIADLDQPPELSTWEGVDGVAIFNKWLMARFLAHTGIGALSNPASHTMAQYFIFRFFFRSKVFRSSWATKRSLDIFPESCPISALFAIYGMLWDAVLLRAYDVVAEERQDAERFIEELRHGVKSVCDFMSGNAIFGGVVDMAREVETVYLAHFHE
ncbi:Transcription factor [Penicillium argentinense]|uniref:Transcription factor n=1 Tax=Penicillium argentinense TaxID=1131581 RepID=A0A9W9FMI0_9EURO|nr:Transcription factor [Penicillium argentinense]KAJ5102635.1 Transcription factor [Penicillium argentinense]